MSEYSHALKRKKANASISNSPSQQKMKAFATGKKPAKNSLNFSVRLHVWIQSFLCISESNINVANREDITRYIVVNKVDDLKSVSSPTTTSEVGKKVEWKIVTDDIFIQDLVLLTSSPSKETNSEKIEDLSFNASPTNGTKPLKSILKKSSHSSNASQSFSESNMRSPSISFYENTSTKSNPLAKKRSMYSRSVSVKKSPSFHPPHEQQQQQPLNDQPCMPPLQCQEAVVVTPTTKPEEGYNVNGCVTTNTDEHPNPSPPDNIIVYSAQYLKISRVPSTECMAMDEYVDTI